MMLHTTFTIVFIIVNALKSVLFALGMKERSVVIISGGTAESRQM